MRKVGVAFLATPLSEKRKKKNYLQLQLQDLLFQLPHFGLFPVSSCLCCDSVFEFPGEEMGERWRGEEEEGGKKGI